MVVSFFGLFFLGGRGLIWGSWEIRSFIYSFMDWKKIESILAGQPAFRTRQVRKALFVDLLDSWNQVSVLPKDLREKLKEKCSLEIKGEVFSEEREFSQKAVLTLADGVKIETVLMAKEEGKNSVCVSCQAGCSLGCAFCATGGLGLQRNLTGNEIIEQILFWQRRLKKQGQKISSVVFMGMGEPFLNYDSVKEAILFLNDKEAFNLSQRKISVSTAGIVEGIKKFSEENWQINLAFSLHFVSSAKRAEHMPIEKTQPFLEVLQEIRAYLEKNKRKVMIEYALFEGANDSVAEANLLAEILKKELGGLFMVNLIAGNPVKDFRPASRKKMEAFQRELERKNIEVVRRFSFGRKIQGACGQLAGGA